MRRIFVLFITSILLFSCGNNNEYTLKGTAEGFADGTKVYLFELDANNASIAKDTLTINGGKFEASYPKREDIVTQILRFDGTPSNLLFFVENENLKIIAYKDSIGASNIIGGRQNELYHAYLSSLKHFNDEMTNLNDAYLKAQREQDGVMIEELSKEIMTMKSQQASYQRDFVAENGNSLFGLMLVNELHGSGEVTTGEVEELLKGLSPKLAEHPTAMALKERIENVKKASIGGTAPNFEAPAPDDNMLALADVLGEYTIIDFWASWCRPCRIENPNVVKVYEKYHDKGLNIISVSLDRPGQKEQWLKAIEDDNLTWNHVSNLSYWQDPIARQYNVRSIPATFLLDKNGVIIDKDLRGAALEARLSQLLD